MANRLYNKQVTPKGYQEGGKVKKKKSRKNPMKDDRAREGAKANYRKMGFGKLIDDGTIDFSNYKSGGRAMKKDGGLIKGNPKLAKKGWK